MQKLQKHTKSTINNKSYKINNKINNKKRKKSPNSPTIYPKQLQNTKKILPPPQPTNQPKKNSQNWSVFFGPFLGETTPPNRPTVRPAAVP